MKNKLMIALFSILSCVSVCTFTMSVTYAWFTYGATLAAGNLDITFKGDRKLQISMDDKIYHDELTEKDLGGTSSFYPVSSMFSEKWITNQETLPILKTGYTRGNIKNPVTYRETTKATTGYFQRELYLKADMDAYVTIDAKSVLLQPFEELNAKKAHELLENYPNKTEEEILASLNKVAKATRISILDPDPETYSYTIIDPNKDGDTYLCGTLSLNSGEYYDYYKKDGEQYEFVYGDIKNEDKIVYDEPLLNDTDLKDPTKEYSSFNAKTRAYVSKFNMEESIKNGLIPTIEQSVLPIQAEKSIAIPVRYNEPKKVVVSIYIEGWDEDNTSDSVFGSFISNLKFKIVEGRL